MEYRPCGLGARDTLRLEAAMPLYGHELSGVDQPVRGRRGLGGQARQGRVRRQERLVDWKAAPGLARVGLKLESKRIARQGAMVFSDESRLAR